MWLTVWVAAVALLVRLGFGRILLMVVATVSFILLAGTIWVLGLVAVGTILVEGTFVVCRLLMSAANRLRRSR
jgi:hypothetical protein